MLPEHLGGRGSFLPVCKLLRDQLHLMVYDSPPVCPSSNWRAKATAGTSRLAQWEAFIHSFIHSLIHSAFVNGALVQGQGLCWAPEQLVWVGGAAPEL